MVRIPLAGDAVDDATPVTPADDVQVDVGKRRRVLVIEDNDDIRETLRTLLTLWGHEVETATEGRTGLERVLTARPDVALVDIGLPGLSGYDVARAIRARLPHSDIRLVAVTGYGQPADRARALAAGFDAHLLKPVAPDALAREIARVDHLRAPA